MSQSKIVVAAIDFGTTYSGYAYSFRHDFEKDPCKVSSNNWTPACARQVTFKTPTTILLNPQKEFESYGYDAEDRYTELAYDDRQDYYYFYRFQMFLYNTQGVKRDAKICGGVKEMPALTVFSMAIKFLKDHLLYTLEKTGTGVKMSDIQWVLTVPAICNDPAKKFMREAAEKAGIDSDNLLIALEPEAASLFCEYMLAEMGKQFQPGNKYIVLDCGGLKNGIYVYQVQKDKTLKIYTASVCDGGGNQVDGAFVHLLIKFVGSKIYSLFCNENAQDKLDMFRNFEYIKCHFEVGDISVIKIPTAFNDKCEREIGEKISVIVQQSSLTSKVNYFRDKLKMSSDLFASFFEVPTSNIVQHLEKLLNKSEFQDTIDVIMVGGFSTSPLLQAKVKGAFPYMNFIIPAEAELSVLKGAVIFGHLHISQLRPDLCYR